MLPNIGIINTFINNSSCASARFSLARIMRMRRRVHAHIHEYMRVCMHKYNNV